MFRQRSRNYRLRNYQIVNSVLGETGFTLFETVLSIALLILVVGTFAGFVVSVQQGRIKLSSEQEVDASIRMALDVMSHRIRSAKNINIVSSVFDTDPGVLSLEMENQVLNPTIFRLNQDNGRILMQEGAQSPVALTASTVSVERIVFSLREGIPANVGIDLTIHYGSQDAYAQFAHSVRTSVTLRH